MKTIHTIAGTFARRLAAVGIALFCAVSAAQAIDYNVELIVYAPVQAADSGEQSSAARDLPDTEHAIMIGESGTRMLEGPRTLQAIADTLRRAKQYRLLLHWYWQQPAKTAAQAQGVLVQIPTGTALPVIALPENLSPQAMNAPLQSAASSVSMESQAAPLLDGTVKLIADEIVQVNVDLIYRDAGIAVPLQLKESRRLLAGELHYLDHARFGVLVRVTPQTASAPAQ